MRSKTDIPRALRRVWSGTDIGAGAGRMLAADDLSRLTALAVRDFMAGREENLGKEIVREAANGRWVMRRETVTPWGDRVSIRSP